MGWPNQILEGFLKKLTVSVRSEMEVNKMCLSVVEPGEGHICYRVKVLNWKRTVNSQHHRPKQGVSPRIEYVDSI